MSRFWTIAGARTRPDSYTNSGDGLQNGNVYRWQASCVTNSSLERQRTSRITHHQSTRKYGQKTTLNQRFCKNFTPTSTALRAWCTRCLSGRGKANVLRPCNEGTRWSNGYMTTAMHEMTTPPPRSTRLRKNAFHCLESPKIRTI